MNDYSRILEDTFKEIDSFSAAKEGSHWEAAWYSRLKENIKKAVEANSNDAAENFLSIVLYMLVDSGPTVEISQSLGIALDTMQAKQKRKI